MKAVSCASPLKLQFHHLIQKPCSSSSSSSLLQLKRKAAAAVELAPKRRGGTTTIIKACFSLQKKQQRSRRVVAVVVGAAVVLFLLDGSSASWALDGGGPLAEEFWDNVRRYGLYILTVSTGAIYTIFQPIAQLLKNPITAVLIIALLLAAFYLVSQVVTAMVGISDFSYNYAY